MRPLTRCLRLQTWLSANRAFAMPGIWPTGCLLLVVCHACLVDYTIRDRYSFDANKMCLLEKVEISFLSARVEGCGASLCMTKLLIQVFSRTALLNYQWALTGGPTTMAEQLMLLASVAASAYPGYGYFKLGAYAPLGCLWVAPWCSAAAFLLGAK